MVGEALTGNEGRNESWYEAEENGRTSERGTSTVTRESECYWKGDKQRSLSD